MLQSIRDNSKGIIAKILVGFIVLTFALFGVESIISLASGSGAPVVVNGEDISELEVRQSINQQRQRMVQQMGENFDPNSFDDNFFRNIAIQQLIDRELQLQWAENNKFSYPESKLNQTILSIPAFQIDGKFDKDVYLDMLGRMGYTPTTFNESLKEDEMISQVRAGIMGSGFTTQKDIELLANLEGEKRTYDYFQISLDKVKESITVSDEQAKAYYEKNQQKYKSLEEVQVEYIVLTADHLASDEVIEDEAIKAAYDEEVNAQKGTQERQVAHILITETEELNADQAKAKAEDLKAQLTDGADFAELAKEHSADTFSATSGGDLGLVTRDIFDDEAFIDVAFNLAVGEISDVVKSKDGFHIIKILDEKALNIPEFEERKSALASELKQAKGQEKLVTATEELKNIAFSAPDLKEPAEEFGLEIKTSPFFTRSGGDDSMFKNRQLINAAFGENVLIEKLNSDAIEIDENQVIVLRLLEHKPARIQDFEEVKEQVLENTLLDLAKKQTQEQADSAIASLSANSDYDVQTEFGVEWKSVTDGGRTGTETSFQVVQKAFAMAKPNGDAVEWDSVTLPNGDVSVLKLKSVRAGELSDFEEQQLTMMKQRLESTTGNSDFINYSKQLKDTAEIEKI